MSEIRIPFVSLNTSETQALTDGILREFKHIVESSRFILSGKVAEFEDRFSKLAGTKHAIAVNSGLDAIILALRSIGVGPGDEVITAPNSFLASASAIALVQATPVFVDVDEDYNLDPKRLESAIGPKTRAVIPVHLTGNPCKMDEIMRICDSKKVAVIEDAAQAVGATYLGRPVGSWGVANAFSLHPLKNLHVWGDGGMITTNDEAIAQNLKLQRNHGLKNRDEAVFFSYNSRLDSLQAVVGLAFSETLEKTNQQRRTNAQIFSKRLAPLGSRLKLPVYDPDKAVPVFHVYQIRAAKRDLLQGHLLDAGIESKRHYPIPIHLQEAAKYLGYKKGDFPVCERLADEIISLPVRENLLESEIHQICDAIIDFYRSN